MAKISTYGIDASPTLNDKVIGTRVEDNNNTYNYTLGDVYDLFQAQGGGGLGFVPYIGANNDVDLGLYTLTTPVVVLDIIEPMTTSISTEYGGNAVGLGLDFTAGVYFLGDYNGLATPSGLSYVIDTTNESIYTTYATDPIGLLIDFNSNAYILGDGASVNNGTYLVVFDDITQTINTFNQGFSKGIGLNFTAEEYYIGDLLKDALIIDNQYNILYTQHNADIIGLGLYFLSGEYVLGDTNVIGNGTYLKVDDTNERVEISKALYTSGSEGAIGQILVSQGAGIAPQWQNHASVANYYGSFYDTTTQTCVSGSIARMKYNTTVLSSGVSIQNDLGGKPTRILIDNAGVYNIQFSAQLNRTTGGTDAQVDIWLRKNDLDIPFSATSITMKANAKNVVAAWNFFETFTAGEYAEIAWTQNDAVEIIQYPADLVVPYPAIPSVILTVNKVG